MFNLQGCSRGRASLHSPLIRSFLRPHETRANLATFSRTCSPIQPHTLRPTTRPSLRNRPAFICKTSLRPYNQGFNNNSSNISFNRNLTRACIGTAVVVYAAWDYSERGIVYSALEKQRVFLQSQGISVPRDLNTRAAHDFLNKYFLLHANDDYTSFSFMGSAFSHKNFLHMAINLLVWSNFANLLYPLSRIHYSTLILGSALASSGAWVYDTQSKGAKGAALGSSGIVSSVMMTATMFYPTLQASLFGILPMPLWILTGGFFALDYYLMESGGPSRVGHSAHLGGAAFGAIYYAIFLRRFGGILGPRRF